MKLCELLGVCADLADMEVQVMINGEGIISSAGMLEGYLCKDALNMSVVGIAAVGDGELKVWVECHE